MEHHYVYIIESISTGKWYYGYTTNLVHRLTFHNQGKNTSTRNRGPWKFIFTKEFNSKKEALDFEKYLKAARNKEYIKRTYPEYFFN
jgi:putative endonuclease